MKPLPSLDVLKTFAVVAQRLNFTRAADILNITQGAVSRQISGLEAHLGYALFVRQARGLALTPNGAMLTGTRDCHRRKRSTSICSISPFRLPCRAWA